MAGSGSVTTGYNTLSLTSGANDQDQLTFLAWLLSRCSGAWCPGVQKRRDGCKRYRMERLGKLGRCKGRKEHWVLDGAGGGAVGKKVHSKQRDKRSHFRLTHKDRAMLLLRQVPEESESPVFFHLRCFRS